MSDSEKAFERMMGIENPDESGDTDDGRVRYRYEGCLVFEVFALSDDDAIERVEHIVRRLERGEVVECNRVI